MFDRSDAFFAAARVAAERAIRPQSVTQASRPLRRVCSMMAASLILTAACTDDVTGPAGSPDVSAPLPRFNLMVDAVTELPVPAGALFSKANDINDQGHAVGAIQFSSGTSYAAMWQNGASQILGSLGTHSHAMGVNNRGQVAGASQLTSGAWRAFFWENGVMQDLGILAGDPAINSSQAFDINDRGQVVGLSTISFTEVRAFLWENGVMTDLGTLGGLTSQAFSINELGQVVGLSQTSQGDVHAFLWENGVMLDLGTLGGVSSRATGINELGQIVGSSLNSQGELRAFLWENGVMQDMGALSMSGESYSMAYGVNDLAQIVGWGPFPLAWLSTDGAMFSLGNGGANSINNHGQAAGYFTNTAGEQHAVVWSVPIRPPADLQPGDATNAVSLKKGRNVALAILSNPWFTAQQVDPATLTLGDGQNSDTPVLRDRRGKLAATYRDVDNDGDVDLVVDFSIKEIIAKGDLSASVTKLVLQGKRNDDRSLRAVEPVTVMP